jgi:hypothetical protein
VRPPLNRVPPFEFSAGTCEGKTAYALLWLTLVTPVDAGKSS